MPGIQNWQLVWYGLTTVCPQTHSTPCLPVLFVLYYCVCLYLFFSPVLVLLISTVWLFCCLITAYSWALFLSTCLWGLVFSSCHGSFHVSLASKNWCLNTQEEKTKQTDKQQPENRCRPTANSLTVWHWTEQGWQVMVQHSETSFTTKQILNGKSRLHMHCTWAVHGKQKKPYSYKLWLCIIKVSHSFVFEIYFYNFLLLQLNVIGQGWSKKWLSKLFNALFVFTSEWLG